MYFDIVSTLLHFGDKYMFYKFDHPLFDFLKNLDFFQMDAYNSKVLNMLRNKLGEERTTLNTWCQCERG